jgi:hypothetical protein
MLLRSPSGKLKKLSSHLATSVTECREQLVTKDTDESNFAKMLSLQSPLNADEVS